MTNYVIEDENEIKTVSVKLVRHSNGEIEFVVGDFTIFALFPNGTGQMVGGMTSSTQADKTGLQIENGKIKLV